MKGKKEKLKLRKKIKSKKPNFVSQDSHKTKRIRKRWRKPRGWHSKIRLNKRGYNKKVSTGYGSPKEVYGLHPSGFKPVMVNCKKDLKGLDKEKEGVIIASSVGNKKRTELLEECKKSEIKVLNIKDVDSFLDKIKKKFEKRKKKRKKLKKKKEKEEKKEKDKDEDKENLSEKLSEEEKKKKAKKEKDKILTKKEK